MEWNLTVNHTTEWQLPFKRDYTVLVCVIEVRGRGRIW